MALATTSAFPGDLAPRAPTARSRAWISLSSAMDVSGASPDFSIRSRKAPDESECDCPGSPGAIDRTVAQSKPCHPVAGCDLEHVVALGAELPRHQRKLPLPGCNRFSGFKRCGLAAEQDRCWRLTQRSHA